MLGRASFILILAFCSPALAQRNLDLDGLHRVFGAPPLSELAGDRGQAARVIVVNGYGSPIVTLDTVRPLGGTPRIIIRGVGDARRISQVMHGKLSAAAWSTLAAGAVAHAEAPDEFERPPQRVVNGDEEEVIICTDGWTTIVETFGFGPARTLRRNSCDRDDVYDYGTTFERIALDALTHCQRLDPYFFRAFANRLSFCLSLTGEQSIAASATNAATPLFGENFTADRVQYVLGDSFSLTLPDGSRTRGRLAAFQRWRAFVTEGDYEIYIDAVVGRDDENSEETAHFDLLVYDDARNTRDTEYVAQAVQTWRRDDNGLWLLTSMQVGQFETRSRD